MSSHLLFNIYTHDLPDTIAKKFVYADNLEIMHSSKNWLALKGALTQDMEILSSYLKNWKLKHSVAKTVTAAFHLHNREAKRELNIVAKGRSLPFSTTRFTVVLSSTNHSRITNTCSRKKLTTRVALKEVGRFNLGC